MIKENYFDLKFFKFFIKINFLTSKIFLEKKEEEIKEVRDNILFKLGESSHEHFYSPSLNTITFTDPA